MKKQNSPQYYHDYLKLNRILDSQHLLSKELGEEAHDEMLFIIIHQVYELWFKQILHELDSVITAFDQDTVDESHIGIAISRLDRIIEIQKILIDQIHVLETMTPMDFLDFRDLLNPASGFQSVQFRVLENKLGLDESRRFTYGTRNYKSHVRKDHRENIQEAEKSPSLFNLLEKWLERTPFLEFKEFKFWEQYRSAVDEMLESDRGLIEKNERLSEDEKQIHLKEYAGTEKKFDALFDQDKHNALIEKKEHRLSYKATQAALLILLYRDQPILHNPYKLINRLVDVDELLTTWRYRHALMVMRMIGRKIGTGGSTGSSYLKETAERHRVFEDLANLTTFLIPRSELPKLPDHIIRNLGFYYDAGENK
ncbi:MAG: tryptophan 2,3-dioxygenase [Candidatus Marinimicrobia bacterium]|nr:tryptophan 2,3-dioxygenase [Candidatus Neomarinimicrobiota bacterium]